MCMPKICRYSMQVPDFSVQAAAASPALMQGAPVFEPGISRPASAVHLLPTAIVLQQTAGGCRVLSCRTWPATAPPLRCAKMSSSVDLPGASGQQFE